MTSKLRVAIVGARDKGIGSFHAREFRNAGAEVVGVTGHSLESAQTASAALASNFQIHAVPYASLDRMLQDAAPDIVVVASPTPLHYDHVSTALQVGAHVLCEKPLVWNREKSGAENCGDAQSLFDLAQSQGSILTTNTQQAYLMQQYLAMPFERAGTFVYELITSGKGNGYDIPLDLLAHPLSMLLTIYPDGSITTLDDCTVDNESTTLAFDYRVGNQILPVILRLGKSAEKKFQFGFLDAQVTRVSEKNPLEASGWAYFLEGGGQRVRVEDALGVSVKHYLAAVQHQNPARALVSPASALKNISLQCQIMDYLINGGKFPV